MNFNRVLICAFSFLLSCGVSANRAPDAIDDLYIVETKYKNIINKINQSLTKNQSAFSNSNMKLAEFVDNNLLSFWSSSKTLKGLLGKKSWTSLALSEQRSLVRSFNNTIQRYVQEGFGQYEGQQLEFVSVKLSPSKTIGYLTIKVKPNLMPNFNIDLKIAMLEGAWFIYDAGAQGINYIKLKKDSFRKQIKNKGINGILTELNTKNSGYIPSQLSK